MPHRGGSAGKVGIRYEDAWTAHCAFKVLRGEATWIHLEPLGAGDDGIEFALKRPEGLEYHQVKRQRGQGEWTVTALRAAGVLEMFAEKLRDPAAHCRFVSMQSASVLLALTEFARKSPTAQHFQSTHLDADDRRAAFKLLCNAWDVDADTVFDRLRRIHVETITEPLLRGMNELAAESLVDGDGSNAAALVIDVLRQAENEILHADELWRLLAERHAIRPATWRGSENLAAQVADANHKYVKTRRDALIGRELIPRTETKRVQEALEQQRFVLVHGAAGTGKSDVLLELVESLDTKHTQFLAFRLDDVSPVRLAKKLGEELGLPSSPVATLDALAGERDSVLVIDQLDIVSATSGRDPMLFDCVTELLEQAKTCPRLRVVAACRTFDLEHDARLRRLVQEDGAVVVAVGTLDDADVRSALDKAGFGWFAPSRRQMDLLRVPLHLALLCATPPAADERLHFATSLELFDRFWDHKHGAVEQRVPGAAWTAAIYALVDRMSQTGRLTAPAAIVDPWARDAAAMESCHVLRRDGGVLSFFHESFFDYAFARAAVARGRDVKTLLAVDQDLFRRAQVRQLLAYSQEQDLDALRAAVAFVLENQGVRFHLKDLTMAWLAEARPDAVLWHLLLPHLSDATSRLHRRSWVVLAKEAWFRYADEVGFLARSLDVRAPIIERVVRVLAAAISFSGDRVAALLRPFVHVDSWAPRISFIVGQPDGALSRQVLNLCTDFIVHDVGRQPRAGFAAHVLSSVVRRLSRCDASEACRLVGAYLRACYQAAAHAKVDDMFDSEHGTVASGLDLDDELRDIARDAPAAFVEHVLPIVFDLAASRQQTSYADELQPDRYWAGRHLSGMYGMHGHLPASLLIAGEIAIGNWARTSPDAFRQLVATRRDCTSETVGYLLVQGFAANPEQLADDAVGFLLDDPRRLAIGYSDDAYWGAHQVLQAIAPHVSADALHRLEAVLLHFAPLRDRHVGSRGRTQLTLLAAIAEARQSPEVRSRLGELRRKFGASAPEPPKGICGGQVRSPIAEDAIPKMSDDAWRGAIAKYQLSRRERPSGSFDDFLKGGAEELARALEGATKTEPERFARLALTLPDTTNPQYFDGILRGVGATGATVEAAAALIERCHALPGRPCGRWIGEPTRPLAAQTLSSSVYDALAWYAMNDPDPPPDPPSRDHGLLHVGLNSARGAIAGTIARLVAANVAHVRPLRASIECLVADGAPAVRAIAAEILLALPADLRDEANRLFGILTADCDDELLGTHFVQAFVWRNALTNIAGFAHLIRRMVSSPIAALRQAGARHATALALELDAMSELARTCTMADDVHLRLGAAEVYAANLDTARFREPCERALAAFFDDPSEEVRDAAAHAVLQLSGNGVATFADLCDRFMRSASFREHPGHLVHALEEATVPVPRLVLRTCTAVVDLWEAEQRGARLTYTCREAIALVLRAYADAPGRAEKDVSLDLVDRALQYDLFGIDKDLAAHDRGWL